MKSKELEYELFTAETNQFINPPSVTLLSATTHGEESEIYFAGGSARTCYSKNIVTPRNYIQGSEKHRENTDRIVRSTREAGHLSTRQHVYYTFALEGVSRFLAWKVLHSYPHHNSEQQSQRYVEMSQEGLMLPQLEDPPLNEIMQSAGQELIKGYNQLTEILTPLARDFYLKRFPARKTEKWQKKVDDEAQKKAQEVARYLLPLGFKTNTYHTVSALTLMRYARLKETYPIGDEAKVVIESMITAVQDKDPRFGEEIDDPLPLEDTPEYQYLVTDFNKSSYQHKFAEEVDTRLAGKPALLDGQDQVDPQLALRLADAVRISLNTNKKLTTEEAIALVLNPKQNPLLSSTLGEGTMNQLTQALNQINLSATISLSQTADAQLQRHRGFNHTQPINFSIPRLEEDIVIPMLLNYSQEALDCYLRIQTANIQIMEELAATGVPLSQVSYLQTNATRVRKRISGPLGSFHHFIKLRTCLNAQEEIYSIALNLAEQLQNLSPEIGAHFDQPAPCGIRDRAREIPRCPEGDHFCGVVVWQRTRGNYPKRDI
jgi:flavin-dependent thymidylate synthase